MKRFTLLAIYCSLLLLLSSCAGRENMYSLSAKLNKLTTTAEGYEQFGNPKPGLSGDEFLQEAVKKDPDLLKQFEEYPILLKRESGNVSIVLCSPDGEQALLQDVGCTSYFDRHIWKESIKLPCEQPTDAFAVCQ